MRVCRVLLCAPLLAAAAMRPLYAPLAGAAPTLLAAPRSPPARRLAAPVRMAGFSFVDALKGTIEKLTDFRVARASHILLKSFDQEALDRLRQWKAQIADDPAAFAEVARNFSQCPSRIKGGELGFFTRGKMVKEFDAVVFSEEPGYVYGPVRTDFGNHLIFIHSCREPKDAM